MYGKKYWLLCQDLFFPKIISHEVIALFNAWQSFLTGKLNLSLVQQT